MSQQTEPAPGGTGGGGPWNPPPPRSHKRLYRRTDDKMIGGVASGLADYFDIDPVLVRIGFVILALLGGAGVLAYLVMWWVVPPTHEVSNAGEDAIRRLKRAPSWVAVALLVIGGVILASQLGPSHGDIIWGIGLIALGGLLFWHTSDRGRREMAPHPAGPVPPAPFAPGPATAEAQATEPDAGTFSASAPRPPPRRRRFRSLRWPARRPRNRPVPGSRRSRPGRSGSVPAPTSVRGRRSPRRSIRASASRRSALRCSPSASPPCSTTGDCSTCRSRSTWRSGSPSSRSGC